MSASALRKPATDLPANPYLNQSEPSDLISVKIKNKTEVANNMSRKNVRLPRKQKHESDKYYVNVKCYT